MRSHVSTVLKSTGFFWKAEQLAFVLHYRSSLVWCFGDRSWRVARSLLLRGDASPAARVAAAIVVGVHCIPIVGALYASATVLVAHTRDCSSVRGQKPVSHHSSFPRICRPACHRHVQSRHHWTAGGAPQAHEGAQCRYLQYQAPVRQRRALANTHAVVPSEDSHQSEYIAPCDARRGQIPRRLSQHTY